MRPKGLVRLVLWADLTGRLGSYHGWVQALVRSVWDEPRPTDPPPLRWSDWGLVGAFAIAAELEGMLRTDLHAPLLSVVLVVSLLPTLLWRRTRPLLMVTIAFGICVLDTVLFDSHHALNASVFMLLLLYSLFRWGSGREAIGGSAVVLVHVLLSMLGFPDLFGAIGVLLAVSAFGAAMRFRARARMRELDQVKLLERERLARDLHDTVAHHVSAMAIRAQAGIAMANTQPAAAVEALHLIETEASKALAEMRGMVRVLRRDQPAELAPSPRVSDLAQLSERDRPGPSVAVDIVGAVDELPPPVGAAIYRLAQESVTNARRHARHATRIEVSVFVDDTSVHLRVSDDGDVGATASSGYGLLGMIERADLLGGRCEAGPNPDRGWTVTAVLPRAGSAR
jgi:signal transduction histidine kinase